MKKIFWIVSLIAASSTWGFAQDQDRYNDNSSDDVYYNDNTSYEQQANNDDMSYQTFYDQLSPYGSWIDYPGYGYVWVPQANAGFSPYMNDGHWVYTEFGWTWVSDYQWGWATFHYGRWFQDPAYGGWLWIPGHEWAPAWVTWGQYEGYYCWAPVGPRDYINGHWGYGNYEHHWNCLPRGRMGETGISRYVVSNTVVNHDRKEFEHKVTVIHNVNTYNRTVYNSGPKAEDVQRVTGHPVQRITVSQVSKPQATAVRGDKVEVYRPTISRNTGTQRAIPANVVRPANEGAKPNTSPVRNEQPRANPAGTQPQRTQPARENTIPRAQPSNNNWTPPRQNTYQQQPQSRPQNNYQQPAQQPAQQAPRQNNYTRPSGGGGFIPSERPAQQQQMPRSEPMRSAPAPSFHAPAGGGARGGGGGRH